MKERPILFSDPMVRAILDGTKTQTRRVVKYAAPDLIDADGWPLRDCSIEGAGEVRAGCPYGMLGDRLWVREAHAAILHQFHGTWIETDYRATYKHGYRLGDSMGIKKRWRPSIHMPRHASRIDLEVTDVRVERLQDISEADALAEGVFSKIGSSPIGDEVATATGGELIYAFPTQAREEYRRLWELINGAGSWSSNPWVWVTEFKRIKP